MKLPSKFASRAYLLSPKTFSKACMIGISPSRGPLPLNLFEVCTNWEEIGVFLENLRILHHKLTALIDVAAGRR